MIEQIDTDLFLEELYEKFNFKSDFLFKGLDPDERRYFGDQMEQLIFRKHDLLYYEGGIPTGVYYLIDGKVKKYKDAFGSEKQILYIYRQGDLLGYHALLSGERHGDSCEAMEECVVGFISADTFNAMINAIPSLRMSVIKNLSHEFGVLSNTISLQAQKSQKVRLAVFLLILERRFNPSMMPDQGIEISRDNLANIAGTSRESLGRTLKEFKENGFIRVRRRKIYISDQESLIELIYNAMH